MTVERSYDAIVVGAGHNGLTLAAYLGRAGLSTLVVERASRIGGMAATEEPLLPGFRHNPHANYLAYQNVMPMIADLALERHGLRTVMPAAQHGIAFADGRPPIVLHRPELSERTHASIARHSRADADLYVELKRRAMALQEGLARGIYAPPAREWFASHAAAVESAYGDLGITAGLAAKSAVELIDELFESPEMRALIYQASAEFGVSLDEPGGGFALLAFQLWMTANWRLPLGGMQSVARALGEACLDVGATVLTDAPVERVLVEDGRAAGVVVTGRGEIRAHLAVASNADLRHTLLDLVGAEQLSGAVVDELRAFAAAPATSLASLMFCLCEPPAFRSARWDPDIDRCFHTMVGFDGPEDALAHVRGVQAGLLPEPAAAVRVNTLWDPAQAPDGFHVAGADSFFPARSALSESEWAEVGDTYNEAFLARWAEFAPNMTRANVLADHFHLAAGFERKVLLRDGAAQYRTDTAGLYLCGASTHPGGGVHGACGYNAYQAIAEDLGLSSTALAASARQ